MKKTTFEPMLAARKVPADLTFPKLASFKIDGYRAVIKSSVALSRKLKAIPNRYVQKILGDSRLNGLDGELTVGPPNAPNLIGRMGEVRREEGEPEFTFWVFDHCEITAGFQARHGLARSVVEDIRSKRNMIRPHIQLLTHIVVRNQAELDKFEEEALALGYEGVMLRDAMGPYKYGRSTEKEQYLIKVKRWEDGEMRIERFEEEMENTNEATKNELGRTKRSSAKAGLVGKGRLGAFIGPDLETGVEVRVGGGFTAQMRLEFWKNKKKYKGQVVTYKHFAATGVKDKRRFTIFRAFREDV